MRVSLNILKKFVNFNEDSVEKLERAFTDKVAEIDEVERQNKGLEKVYIGQIEKIEKHPNADKMQVTQTRVGNDLFQIVCGAKNIYEGQKVSVALSGAVLPGGFEIKKADKRGVESNGMICSESELGLVEESEGILNLPEDAPSGEFFYRYYDLDDTVFVIENTAITNRPDLFSHIGWAREAVAIGVASWKPKNEKTKELKSLTGKFPFSFEIEDGVCTRMQALKISKIKNTKSPAWLQKNLLSLGIRPISLLVDLTNYVMFEIGVPIHAFDLSKISGNKIKMRKSKKGEKVTTLDGVERELPENVILMEDETKVFDLCGIMGGENSGVDENTSESWIHVPVYDPVLIRRAAIALAHRTDASTIYEKRVPDSEVPMALTRITELLLELSPGAEVFSEVFDYFPKEEKELKITLSKEKLNYYIGEKLPEEKVTKILSDLSFEISENGEFFEVTVPSFRLKDIEIEEDLIEEVMRVYGLDTIPSYAPDFEMKIASVPKSFYLEKKAKEILVGQGLFETLNLSFLSKKLLEKSGFQIENLIELKNPLSEELALMRPSLLPYLFEKVEKNLLNEERFGLFEIAKVFLIQDGKKLEKKNLALACYNSDFFQVKETLENLFEKLGTQVQFQKSKELLVFTHGGQSADLIFQGKKIGILATLHPKIAKNFDFEKALVFAELDFEAILNGKIRTKKYKEFSRLPSSTRDLSFITSKKTEVATLLKKLTSADSLISEVSLIDSFESEKIGADKKSLTFSFTFSADKTLTDEEIEVAYQKIIQKAESEGLEFR